MQRNLHQHALRKVTHGRHKEGARLDNLGKGASGAAVQNLKLMLGI